MFGLSPNKEGVFRWNRQENQWHKVGGPAKEIAGKESIVLLPFSSKSNRIYISSLLLIPVADGHLYGISPAGDQCWKYSGSGDQWHKVSNHIRHLIGGGTTQIYI